MYVTLCTSLIGIALLLSGIFFMRRGLQNLLFNKLKQLLAYFTTTSWRGVLFGTIAAAMMQSSTAVSLLTISFVNADYLSFYQGLSIILGANIGTCSTVQLMTLSLPSDAFLPLLVLAVLMTLTVKKFRYIGMASAGLCSMFLGITLLTDSLSQLTEIITIIDYIIAAKENAIYGISAGIIITLLFQSSSAATGLLMVLANDGILNLATATYVVYGNNIGSCLSSVLVGAMGTLSAKRLAAAHILLNLIGVAFFLPFTNLLTTVATYLTADFAGQVAIVHTLFNIISSLAILPILRQYANAICCLLPSRER